MAIDNRVHGSSEYDTELLRRPVSTRPGSRRSSPCDEPARHAHAPRPPTHLGVPATAIVLPGTIDSITSAVGTGAIAPTALSW